MIWLADQSCQGFLVLSDTIRPESRSMIHALSEQNTTPVLLTGDNANAAQAIAGQLGITQVRSGCLPEDKLQFIRTAQEQQQPVCMIGDGINDAPVLTRADVGIAMGAMGSDAAIEAADVVLMDDKPSNISRAIRVARKTMAIVWQNIIFALGIKLLILVLAALGIANMWLAVFGDVGVAIIAILNAMRAMGVKNL